MTASRASTRPIGIAYTALAAIAWSLAGILQRQLHMSLASQLAGRAVFSSLAVLVFVAVAERGRVVPAFRAIGRTGLAVAVLMTISSGSFITALNDAPVADVMVIGALAPLAAALLGMLAGERVRPWTWAAMGLAVGGFALMAGSPTRPSLAGLTFSFIAMLGYAAMIVVARRKAEVSMAPATCLSQVLVFAIFAPFAHVTEMGGPNLGFLALMGVVQMGLALFFLALGTRLIPAVEVALIAQLETVLAQLWVWLAGLERPSAATIAGGIVVIGAVALQVTQGNRAPAGLRRRPGELLGDLADPVASTEPAESP